MRASIVAVLASCWTGSTPPPERAAAPTRPERYELAWVETNPLDGFERTRDDLSASPQADVYISRTQPRIVILITMDTCREDLPCLGNRLAGWRDQPRLRELLLPALSARADTEWQVGETTVRGWPLIYTYQLGFDPIGSSQGAYSHAYVLYGSDETSQIRVVVQDDDASPADLATLRARVPRSVLEALAKSVIVRYMRARPRSP